MVSTRGAKIKFSDGERVLCYEPDPTKAKVLYDSKVLQVVHNKDSKGRKQIEYLIHFQGWNASWDRRVSEDYVLRDTEENRELQKQLAKKAHIKLSIKSNRVLLGSGSSSKERKRRRRLSETIRETIERERRNRAESDTSSQTGTGTTEDDVESLSSSEIGSTTNQDDEEDEEATEAMSDEEAIARLVPLHLPDALRSVIEKDFYFINDKKKLVDLPAGKSALALLEDYVKFFALRYVARNKGKRKSDPREREKTFITLDLCKEVMDGIRVCFDFYLHSLLLYPREREQAEKLKSATPHGAESDDCSLKLPPQMKDGAEAGKENKLARTTPRDDESEDIPRRILRSKRPLLEDSTLLPEAKEAPKPLLSLPQLRHSQPQVMSCESGRSTPSTFTSGTSGVDGTVTLPLSELNLLDLPSSCRGLNNLTLLPETFRNPPTPSLLYGANHLLRLFVKMPEILFRMNLPADRRKVVLHHMELFLDYLNLHISELFPDSNYINAEM